MEPQKCTFKGCENRGEPQDGFDFFVCARCVEAFDKELHRAWLNKYFPHLNN